MTMIWVINLMKKTWVISFALLLSACGDSEFADLRAEVSKINARKNTNVPQLPEFKHIPSYFYEVEQMRDPFFPFMEAGDGLSIQSIGSEGSENMEPACTHPDLASYRVKAELERIPIDALEMVGTLIEENDDTLWGLVISKSEGIIYRVRVGDYIGTHSGKVTAIYEDKIELLELIPDNEGCWQEQFSTIALVGSQS